MTKTHLLVLLASVPAVAFARSPRSEVVARALPESVKVKLDVDGEPVRVASGVVIASRGGERPTSWVLTNAHVVELAGLTGVARFHVSTEGARALDLPAAVVAQGRVPDVDLAVLEVTGAALTPAEFAEDADTTLGDDVLVVAAPYGKSLSVSSGIVSQLEGGKMKTDAPVGYGASGGGVFGVPGGKLLGVVEGYRTARVAFAGKEASYGFDVPMPGETFVAHVSKIRRFLAEHGLAQLLPQSTAARVTASPAKDDIPAPPAASLPSPRLRTTSYQL